MGTIVSPSQSICVRWSHSQDFSQTLGGATIGLPLQPESLKMEKTLRCYKELTSFESWASEHVRTSAMDMWVNYV